MARFLGLRGPRLTGLVSVVCGLCLLCFGYAQGVLGGLLTSRAFLSRFPQVDILNPAQTSFHDAWVTGLTVGSWHLGCLVSAILTIFIGDFLGRRRTLLLGITIWTIGEVVQASSYSFAQFIVGRGIAGFGNGFTTSTAPAYQAECVKPHRKGTMLMISAGAFVAAGYALSYWVVFGFSYITGSSAAWRVPIAFQIIFALPAILLLLVLPESPRWLILSGREEEALTTLAALNDADINGFEIREEFLQIKDAILTMAHGSSASIFSNKDRRGFHRIVLAYFVQVFQQGTGINLVLQYLSWILLTRMSYSGWLARLLAACCGTSYFFSSFVAVVGIDRFWGRRSLMMFGAAGMCASMILLSVLQYLWTHRGNSGARAASTVFLFTFSMFFAIGWQGMAWLYQVEIVPLPIRGPANAISTSANWMLNFVIVFITPIAFTNIGYRTWIIFAATNLAIIPLIFFFYPETAFRSLEEVDVIFALADEMPGNKWLNVVHVSKSEPLWFGRRGEKRAEFDYENSYWHQKLVNSSSGNSGSGSGSDRAMNEKRRAPDEFGRELTRTDTGQAVLTTSITGGQDRQAASVESLVDPRLSTVLSPQVSNEHSHENRKSRSSRKTDSDTFQGTTLNSVDATIETPREPLPNQNRNSWYESHESFQSVGAASSGAHTPRSIHAEATPEQFPSPPASPTRSQRHLSINHHHSVRSATSATSAAHRSFLSVEDASLYHATTTDSRAKTPRDSWISYPGRVGQSITRTSSGRETYYPDGLPEAGEGPAETRYPERQGVRNGHRLAARDAGRAF